MYTIHPIVSSLQSSATFLSGVVDCLLPAVSGLISHSDGDVRVVIASVLRRMLPHTLKGDPTYIHTYIFSVLHTYIRSTYIHACAPQIGLYPFTLSCKRILYHTFVHTYIHIFCYCEHVCMYVCMYVCEAYLQEDQQSAKVVVQKIQSFLKKILPLTHTYMLHDQPPIPQYYVRMLADITNISHQLARSPSSWVMYACVYVCVYICMYVCMYVCMYIIQ